MWIWGTRVSALQLFGYTIALGGLIYYKLGAATLREYLSQAGRAWAEYGAKHPAMRKVLVFFAVLLLLFLLLGGLAPSVGYDPQAAIKNSIWLKNLLGSSGDKVLADKVA